MKRKLISTLICKTTIITLFTSSVFSAGVCQSLKDELKKLKEDQNALVLKYKSSDETEMIGTLKQNRNNALAKLIILKGLKQVRDDYVKTLYPNKDDGKTSNYEDLFKEDVVKALKQMEKHLEYKSKYALTSSVVSNLSYEDYQLIHGHISNGEIKKVEGKDGKERFSFSKLCEDMTKMTPSIQKICNKGESFYSELAKVSSVISQDVKNSLNTYGELLFERQSPMTKDEYEKHKEDELNALSFVNIKTAEEKFDSSTQLVDNIIETDFATTDLEDSANNMVKLLRDHTTTIAQAQVMRRKVADIGLSVMSQFMPVGTGDKVKDAYLEMVDQQPPPTMYGFTKFNPGLLRAPASEETLDLNLKFNYDYNFQAPVAPLHRFPTYEKVENKDNFNHKDHSDVVSFIKKAKQSCGEFTDSKECKELLTTGDDKQRFLTALNKFRKLELKEGELNIDDIFKKTQKEKLVTDDLKKKVDNSFENDLKKSLPYISTDAKSSEFQKGQSLDNLASVLGELCSNVNIGEMKRKGSFDSYEIFRNCLFSDGDMKKFNQKVAELEDDLKKADKKLQQGIESNPEFRQLELLKNLTVSKYKRICHESAKEKTIDYISCDKDGRPDHLTKITVLADASNEAASQILAENFLDKAFGKDSKKMKDAGYLTGMMNKYCNFNADEGTYDNEKEYCVELDRKRKDATKLASISRKTNWREKGVYREYNSKTGKMQLYKRPYKSLWAETFKHAAQNMGQFAMPWIGNQQFEIDMIYAERNALWYKQTLDWQNLATDQNVLQGGYFSNPAMYDSYFYSPMQFYGTGGVSTGTGVTSGGFSF